MLTKTLLFAVFGLTIIQNISSMYMDDKTVEEYNMEIEQMKGKETEKYRVRKDLASNLQSLPESETEPEVEPEKTSNGTFMMPSIMTSLLALSGLSIVVFLF